jgi:hypothetical protein
MWRPYGTRFFLSATRHCRAGLQIMASLRDLKKPTACDDGPDSMNAVAFVPGLEIGKG